MRSRDFLDKIKRISFYILVIFLFLFMVSPIFWIVATSVQPYLNLTDIPPKIRLSDINFNSYAKLFNDNNFVTAQINTLIITLGTSLISITLASISAFTLSYFNFRGKKSILFLTTSIQMAPAIVLLIPLYIVMRNLQLIDTYIGNILVMSLFISPLAVWMLKSFFKEIPLELIESARIDGCTRIGAMIKILLPLGASGIFATFIFCFITSWNELLIPLTISMTKTITLTMYASSLGTAYDVDYAGAAAVSVLSSIPTIVLALAFQKYLVRGFLEGSVKG